MALVSPDVSAQLNWPQIELAASATVQEQKMETASAAPSNSET